MSNAYLDDCLTRRAIFFTGKGGVGKSSVAWATALACRRRGARVVLAAWNPLNEALAERAAIFGLKFVELETLSAFREYVLQLLKFERIYDTVFDNRVLRTFVKAAPGLSETVIAGKIWDLVDKRDQDIVIVDLPASGHAVSFFQSPHGVKKIFPVGFIHRETAKVFALFESKETRLDLVALPEELPVTECRELKQKLSELYPFHFGYAHVNQVTPAVPAAETTGEWEVARRRYAGRVADEREAIRELQGLALPILEIPRLPSRTRAETIERVAASLSGEVSP